MTVAAAGDCSRLLLALCVGLWNLIDVQATLLLYGAAQLCVSVGRCPPAVVGYSVPVHLLTGSQQWAALCKIAGIW